MKYPVMYDLLYICTNNTMLILDNNYYIIDSQSDTMQIFLPVNVQYNF